MAEPCPAWPRDCDTGCVTGFIQDGCANPEAAGSVNNGKVANNQSYELPVHGFQARLSRCSLSPRTVHVAILAQLGISLSLTCSLGKRHGSSGTRTSESV
ncbi:hypothetical protein E2C01_054784 [Portunus trituberculatus]|uniref:Uncharacterized protein n=1 Tax=Portunus trituberculatus TaxID=210409 RepID=A0A5B7GUV7_PORTR|nr:hypothetical protein [Portunus trituberculatus]